MNCLLCLEVNLSNGIQINSSAYDDQNVQSIIEKHLWPMNTFVTESHCVCTACWQELSGFDKFYRRIEDAHLEYKIVLDIKTECESVTHGNLFEPEIQLDMGVEATKQGNIDFNMENGNIEDNIPVLSTSTCTDSNSIEDPLNKTITKIKKTKSERMNNRQRPVNSNESPIKKQEKIKVEDKTEESDSEDSMQKTDSSNSNLKSESKSQNHTKINSRERDKLIAKHFKLICNICQESPFETFPLLLKHFGEVHNERGYAMCCEVKFYERSKLVDHINYHLDPEYFKCKHCSKLLTQRQSLLFHLKLHEEKQFSCDICSKQFMDKCKLEQHKLRHMPQEERKFPCDECGKFYSTKTMLTNHQNVVHLNKYEKLCYICGESCTDANSFRLHMERHEGIQYSCEVYGLIVAGKRPLKVHMESQHPEGGKKYHTCPICSHISPSLRAHKKHIHYTHEMGYDHKCAICDKAFKRPENLKAHIAIHTGNDLYSCPWCPKTFKSNGNMHKHRKTVHPKEWEEDKRDIQVNYHQDLNHHR